MTPAQIKALIEPTQDGAKFSIDPLMAYLEIAIDIAVDTGEVVEKINSAITLLGAAKRALERIDDGHPVEIKA